MGHMTANNVNQIQREPANLKSDAIDFPTSSQLPIDAILWEEIKWTTNNWHSKIIMISSKIIKDILV